MKLETPLGYVTLTPEELIGLYKQGFNIRGNTQPPTTQPTTKAQKRSYKPRAINRNYKPWTEWEDNQLKDVYTNPKSYGKTGSKLKKKVSARLQRKLKNRNHPAIWKRARDLKISGFIKPPLKDNLVKERAILLRDR